VSVIPRTAPAIADRHDRYVEAVAALRFDQINIVLPDVVGATRFLGALGAQVQEVAEEWAEWAPHHAALPRVSDGFDADLDSPAFASYWGGLPSDFAGVVVNLRAADRAAVDAAFERAVALGAEGLRPPYDAFWGVRYAVVRGPGPIVVGIISPADPAARTDGPQVSDFA
jgi:uncharacterized glyoxalase superfamily protein PhnB